MTILQANKFYYPRWGADRYFFDLSNWLRDAGHTVVPFAMKHPENLPTPYERYFPSFVQTERLSVGWQGLPRPGACHSPGAPSSAAPQANTASVRPSAAPANQPTNVPSAQRTENTVHTESGDFLDASSQTAPPYGPHHAASWTGRKSTGRHPTVDSRTCSPGEWSWGRVFRGDRGRRGFLFQLLYPMSHL
jgi:hypothetical protein